MSIHPLPLERRSAERDVGFGGADIIAVDDDPAARVLVRTLLEADGHLVTAVDSISGALDAARARHPDLLIVDLRLPDGTGFDLLGELASLGGPAAVVVSASEAVEARLRAFRLGADDFLVKPFDPDELSARVRAVLRRAGKGAGDEAIAFGDLEVDLACREVRVAGAVVDTTAKEFDLLAYLATHPGRVYTRAQLLAAVWHSSSEWQQEGTVTEHVRRLRHKLGDLDGHEWIQTVRGVGYRFDRRQGGRTDASGHAARSA